MQRLRFYLLCILGFISSINATTFIPIPIEQQVSDSYGVIRAYYIGESSKKLPTGEVITQASFKIIESAGLKPNEIINRNDFKVLYPGGKYNGIVYQIQGTPKFKPKEEVVLLLDKSHFGFSIKNLSLGKYQVYKKNGLTYLSSSVFSSHPNLGRIRLKEFDVVLKDRFGHSLTNINKDLHVYVNNKKKVKNSAFASLNQRKSGRSIASLDNQSDEANAGEQEKDPFWLILAFSLMGIYSTFFLGRSRRNRDL